MSTEIKPLEVPSSAVAGADDDVYGLLVVAGIEVALSLSALREVVPTPDQFRPLLANEPGLLGAMELRGLIVPVVDLSQRFDSNSAKDSDAHKVIAIINDNGRVLGIVAEQLHSVTRIGGDRMMGVHVQESVSLVNQAFRHPVHGGIVSVLDVPAIFELPGIPSVEDTSFGSALGVLADVMTGKREEARKYTVLQCGEYVFALDIAYVHTTLPNCVTKPSVIDSALCRGVTEYMGNDVPVVDPLHLLGLGALEPAATGPGLVMDFGTGNVVLALTALLDISEIASGQVMELPEFAVHQPNLITGVVDFETTGQCLVLNGASLLEDSQLRSHSKMNTPIDGIEDVTTSNSSGNDVPGFGDAQIIYSVGVDIATPLEQVSEILPYPTNATKTNVGDNVVGIISHRGAIVPVLSLANLLGRSVNAITPASCILLVGVDDGHVAFAVDTLRTIDPLAWEDPAARDTTEMTLANAATALSRCGVIQVSDDTRLLPQLDLSALARAVQPQESPIGAGDFDDLEEIVEASITSALESDAPDFESELEAAKLEAIAARDESYRFTKTNESLFNSFIND